METRQIGKSGIETSALALGCWAIGGGSWWGDNDDQMSVDTIHRAFDLGIRWIDTARVYGFGHSEEVVGRALKELPRDQVIISTKCALQWYEQKGEYHVSRDPGRIRWRESGHDRFHYLVRSGHSVPLIAP